MGGLGGQRAGADRAVGALILADEAWDHRVYGYAGGAEFQGQGSDQGLQPGFGGGGGGKGGKAGAEGVGDKAGDGDDASCFGGLEVRRGGLGEAEEGALDGFGGVGEGGVGEIGERGAVGETGVADQDVEAAEMFGGGGNQLGGDCWVGEVAQGDFGGAAGGADGGGDGIGAGAVLPGVEEDGGVRCGHDAADGGADAAGGAGYQDYALGHGLVTGDVRAGWRAFARHDARGLEWGGWVG